MKELHLRAVELAIFVLLEQGQQRIRLRADIDGSIPEIFLVEPFVIMGAAVVEYEIVAGMEREDIFQEQFERIVLGVRVLLPGLEGEVYLTDYLSGTDRLQQGGIGHFPIFRRGGELTPKGIDTSGPAVGVVLLVHLQRFAGSIEGLVHGKQAAVGGIEAYHVRYQELGSLQFQCAVLVVVKDFFKFRAVVSGSGQGGFKPHISLRSTGTKNNNQ